VPDVRYSVTTSRHQGIARRADTGPSAKVAGANAALVRSAYSGY
jgi:hypothetical protein